MKLHYQGDFDRASVVWPEDWTGNDDWSCVVIHIHGPKKLRQYLARRLATITFAEVETADDPR